MKTKEITSEHLIKTKDGRTVECPHINLVEELRKVSSGKNFSDARFIVCHDCGELIAHIPRMIPPSKQNNSMQININNQFKQIIDLLTKIHNQQNKP